MARVSVELADREVRALEQVAASEGATVVELVRRAIRNYLAAHADPDPDWQRRYDEVIARIQSRIPPEISPEEIEADVRAARAEVREARRARGR